MEVESYSNKIAKGAGIAFFGMFIGRLLAYFYNIILAKLGTTKFGLISLAIAIINLLIIFSLAGLKTGVLRYVSYYRGLDNQQKIKGALLSSFIIALPLSIIFSFLLFILSEEISIYIFHIQELSYILKLFALTTPFSVITALSVAVMRAFHKIGYNISLKEIIERGLMILFTLLLIYLGFDLFGAVLGYVLAIIFTSLSAIFLLEFRVYSFIKSKIKTIQYKKEIFIFSLPLTFIGILSLFIKWTDVLMLGYFRSVSEVGIYSAAIATSALMLLVPTALLSLFMPIISELYSKNKLNDINNVSKRTLKWIFIMNFPLFLFISLFSKQILSILFGTDYGVGYIALIILVLGHVPYSLGQLYSEIMSTINKTKVVFYIALTTVIVNIILNYYLIPIYGMVGGAVSTSISLLLMYLIYTIVTYKLINIQILNFDYIKAIISGIISIYIIYFFTLTFNVNTIFTLVFFSLLFLLIYVILLFLLKGFEEEDKEVIYTIIKKFKH